MLASGFGVLIVGFGLGLMHALDADHVMAVSTLSSRKPGFWRTLRFCSHWAAGHGLVILLIAALLFGIGVQVPPALQHLAEMSVGVLLIVLGLFCLWQFRRQKLRVSMHSHGDVVHTHVHDTEHGDTSEAASQTGKITDKHTPAMVGMLHGLAGSAPAMALVPSIANGQLSYALIYLSVFSLGVAIAMVVFGLGLGAVQQFLREHYQRLFMLSRYIIAIGSVVLGCFWLAQGYVA